MRSQNSRVLLSATGSTFWFWSGERDSWSLETWNYGTQNQDQQVRPGFPRRKLSVAAEGGRLCTEFVFLSDFRDLSDLTLQTVTGGDSRGAINAEGNRVHRF